MASNWFDALIAEKFHIRLMADDHPLAKSVRVPKQVHGIQIVNKGGMTGDGIFTDQTNQWIGVQTADCLPLFLGFPERILVLHAGWRGLSQGIIKVSQSLWQGLPELVFLGPAIQACCYQVGSEVAKHFPGWVDEEGYLDLSGFACEQLHQLGVSPQVIFQLPWCTFCSSKKLPSYRREGKKASRILNAMARLA